MEAFVEVKKWGNSLGVLLPKSSGLREGDELHLYMRKVSRKTKVKDFFGMAKLPGVNVGKLMRKVDRELWGE